MSYNTFVFSNFIRCKVFRYTNTLSLQKQLIYNFLCRYQHRRSPSRSISRGSDGYHGSYRDRSQSRSPIGSPSPRDKRFPISEGLRSRLGPKVDEEGSPNRQRSRSRSSRSSDSKSPKASPPKNRRRIGSASPSRSSSSSPSGQRGLVSYADQYWCRN